jgi:hypothetical protein
MSREAELFTELSKDLLSKLGYHIVKEDFIIQNAEGAEAVDLCIDFADDLFLPPKYAPKGITFVECKEVLGNNVKPLNDLEKSIEHANKNDDHVKRLHGRRVSGGLLLINEKGVSIDKAIIDNAASKEFYLWDQSRIFFYAMKVFGHSVLENWVSQNRLGVVLNEEEMENQFHSEMFHTTVFVGVRYGEQLKNVEIYFSYYVDCLKSPEELDSQHDALHTENVKEILDDVYERLEEINKKYYPRLHKSVTIEIHSLSGFTKDAENNVKLYSKHHKDWSAVNALPPKVDEHTLFKYATIPWEAVMDFAFTKRTGRNTKKREEVDAELVRIEEEFTKEFEDGIRDGHIRDPFTDFNFKHDDVQNNFPTMAGYKPILVAELTEGTPIHQRMLIFSRTKLKDPKINEIKKIIMEIKSKQDFQYTWIGLMSGSGFSWEVLEYNSRFNERGIGFGLVDAVTKKLYVNKETNEGKKLNQMFLSECITS